MQKRFTAIMLAIGISGAVHADTPKENRRVQNDLKALNCTATKEYQNLVKSQCTLFDVAFDYVASSTDKKIIRVLTPHDLPEEDVVEFYVYFSGLISESMKQKPIIKTAFYQVFMLKDEFMTVVLDVENKVVMLHISASLDKIPPMMERL